jgi:hypothetical protein
MADEIKYRNLVQRNDESVSSFEAKAFGSDNKGPIDEVREKMKDQYGWLSPSEYYYGSEDDSGEEVERTDLMTVFYPKALGLSDEENIFESVEAAEKDNIPNWFWVDSLSNWCYIKPTVHMVSGSLGGNAGWGSTAAHLLVGILAGGGDFVLAAGLELAQMYAEGKLDGDWYVDLPTNIVTDWVDASVITADKIATAPVKAINWYNEKLLSAADRITGGISGRLSGVMHDLIDASKVVTDRLSLATVSAVISTMIQMFFSSPTADGEAESVIEIISECPLCELSRNCLSLYMWNGFLRSWMPVKWMIELYDRYMKKGNNFLLQMAFADKNGDYSSAISKISNNNNRDLYLYTIVPESLIENQELLSENDRAAVNSFVTRYRDAWANWDRDHNNASLINSLKGLIRDSYNEVNLITRTVFMQVYIFDPACLESFTTRSPLNKQQIISTSAGTGWRMGSTPHVRWLENWGMWMPLPLEKAKIKLYARSTFQLINRPYNGFINDYLVSRGNIHTNIGHPCFMRGNDNVLWIAYWLRWSSSTKIASHGDGGFFGTGLGEGTYYNAEGLSDITDKDIENWNAIIDSMFEKHDEYGFEDWMINGNYGLSYSKFTIDEESPTDVSSFEESELNPEKVPIVNSIDWVPKSKMVLRLSDNTVVNRDDKNGMSHAAKRW